jgi:hypothetical protein
LRVTVRALEIQSLPPDERRHIMQLGDALIERGQLKRRAGARTGG